LIEIPERLGWWRDRAGGVAWLESLPRLAEECAEHWSLRLGEPFGQGHVSLTVPVALSDGGQAVLKLNFPEEESASEADALLHWRGEGAVRLLELDRERNALLIERADPGTSLWEVGDDEEAILIAASVMARLWLRPPPDGHRFRLLAGEAERWTAQLRSDWEALGRPFEQRLVDAAAAAAGELAGSLAKAGGLPPGSPGQQRPEGTAGAVACDRSEADCRGARVRRRVAPPRPPLVDRPGDYSEAS